MPRRFLVFTIRSLRWLAMPALLASCGPASPTGPVPAPGSSSVRTPDADTAAAESDPLERIEREVGEAIVRVRGSAVALEYTASGAPSGARRVASGVVISEAGDVLSVRIDRPPSSSEAIVARDVAGRRLDVEWVAADPETGLTLLKLKTPAAGGSAGFRPAVPAPRGARLGMPVLVVGNPFGLAHSVSRGAVAGLERRLDLGRSPLGRAQLGRLIQVDASLHPGDSGALLADLRGGWLGVIRSGLAPPDDEPGDRDRDRDADGDAVKGRDVEKPARGKGHGNGNGNGNGNGGGSTGTGTGMAEHGHDLGFAITAADALWVAGQLRECGRVDRAYLGVGMNPLTATEPATPGSPEPRGVALNQVVRDTPAALAGLKRGDRIVALDGRPVRSPFDLTDHLDRTVAGVAVNVEWLHGRGPAAERRTKVIRTSRRPSPEVASPKLGDAKDKAGAAVGGDSGVARQR